MDDPRPEERHEIDVPAECWPPYAFIPGGPWPHPMSLKGHMHGNHRSPPPPIQGEGWPDSTCFLRGVALFNSGHYWEAHEEWEGLWHAHGRAGPTADVLKALIKLAAAGVKVRQGQRHGVIIHATRAAALLDALRDRQGPIWLGLDLERLSSFARNVAATVPADPGHREDRVVRVFDFRIGPAGES